MTHQPSTNNPSDDWRPGASRATLQRRAQLLERVRRFLCTRGALEVEVPVLQGGANLDPGIAPFRLDGPGGARWLPTSPEHPLKRLVAAGCGDVWALHPAFRAGERSRRHRPEFRMLEWYRVGWDDRRLLGEVVELLAELTGLDGPCTVLPWRQALERHAGVDPFTADESAIAAALGAEAGVVRGSDGRLDREAAADLLLATRVEPHLGRGEWTAITDYPPRLAAQARTRPDARGEPVAARFEIYRDGLELANGYWELTDAAELVARLDAERRTRADAPARDARFEAAMAAGLPECAGVAVGFDRVVMLALGLADLGETMAFPWERA